MRWVLALMFTCACDDVFGLTGRTATGDAATSDGTASDGAASDAPLGPHDEDGDTVDDTEDVCPGIADDQSDTDTDGVGDACDPDAGAAGARESRSRPMSAA